LKLNLLALKVFFFRIMKPLNRDLVSVVHVGEGYSDSGGDFHDGADCYDDYTSRFEWAVSESSLMRYNLSRGINFDLLGCMDASIKDGIVPPLVADEQDLILNLLDNHEKVKVMSHSVQTEICIAESSDLGSRNVELDRLSGSNAEIVKKIDILAVSQTPATVVSKLVDASFRFPGTMFGNITPGKLDKLNPDDYLLSVKLDGVRALLIIHNDVIYLFDRRLKGFIVGSLKSKFMNVVFDCEVMLDGDELCFVLFDVVTIKDKLCTDDLLCRVRFISDACKQLDINVLPQQYYPCYRIDLLKDEGIVFSPVNQGYKIGFSNDHFKWKLKGDTADLLVTKHGKNKCLVSANYVDRRLDSYKIVKICSSVFPFSEGSILECSYVGGSWHFVRIRDDKTVPNATWVVDNVIKSCKDCVPFGTMYYHLRRYKCFRAKDLLYSFYRALGGDVKVFHHASVEFAVAIYVRPVSADDWTSLT